LTNRFHLTKALYLNQAGGNMRSFLVIGVFTAFSSVALADSSFFVSTDRVSYTGTVTRYDSLVDAQNGTNSVGGPYTIPARNTAAPYNTAYRDAGFFFSKDMPSYYADSNILATAWWYTTAANTNGAAMDDPSGNRYQSGWGNPNNTNTGFLQLYDGNGSTDTSANGYFSGYAGGKYTEFTLEVSGQNANAADYARLWPAPAVGGAAGLSAGVYHSYDLDITFTGLEGVVSGADIVATDHPDGVNGTFNAIFENTNTLDAAYRGFYVLNFTFGMDNWAFAQGDAALNGDLSPSLFATHVPAPGAALLALIGLPIIGWVKRKIA
jgi:hypothetical protein